MGGSSLRSAILGRPRRPIATAIPSGLVMPDYRLGGLSDTAYLQGPAGVGGTPITIRAVLYIAAIPSTAQRILFMLENASVHGARLFTGHGGLAAIQALYGGSGGFQITPQYTIGAGDVGKLMVVHTTVDTVARLAVGGAEVGSGSSAVTVTAPGASARVTVGRSQHNLGFAADPNIGIVSLCVSATAMTMPQIAADAAAIMGRSRGLVFPELPGETMRYVAADIAGGGDWHDRVGDDCTLTRVGSPTVTRVP